MQLLESGCITDRRFQAYEAHIPFLLQVLKSNKHWVVIFNKWLMVDAVSRSLQIKILKA